MTSDLDGIRGMVAHGLTQFDSVLQDRDDLQRGLMDANVAIRGLQVENEALRLQLAERDNRLVSIQSEADERAKRLQDERDDAIRESAHYSAIYTELVYYLERMKHMAEHAPEAPQRAPVPKREDISEPTESRPQAPPSDQPRLVSPNDFRPVAPTLHAVDGKGER